ncbi:MAG: hypothetical protein RL717_1395 [Pseudomonadota bacterium]
MAGRAELTVDVCSFYFEGATRQPMGCLPRAGSKSRPTPEAVAVTGEVSIIKIEMVGT